MFAYLVKRIMRDLSLSLLFVLAASSFSAAEPHMVFVKGGCFTMIDVYGDDTKTISAEQRVCPDDFHIGNHEVTQSEWEELMGRNPSRGNKGCLDCPVDSVSWEDVVRYIERLNKKTGMNYRLPTEAEWEYAARSGGKQERWAGTDSEEELVEYAWYEANSNGTPHPVGLKKPNGLGLYDMSGNVKEWTSDWFFEYDDTIKDMRQAKFHVFRGGDWFVKAFATRTSHRGYDMEFFSRQFIGFRLAHSAEDYESLKAKGKSEGETEEPLTE